MAGEGERGVDECVGLDEGAIEVDAEDGGGWFGDGSRVGQKECPSFGEAITVQLMARQR